MAKKVPSSYYYIYERIMKNNIYWDFIFHSYLFSAVDFSSSSFWIEIAPSPIILREIKTKKNK